MDRDVGIEKRLAGVTRVRNMENNVDFSKEIKSAARGTVLILLVTFSTDSHEAYYCTQNIG